MVKGAPDYAGVAKRVLRPDIYLEAMKEMGVTPKVAEDAEDHAVRRHVFDGKDPEKYARVVPDQQPARDRARSS